MPFTSGFARRGWGGLMTIGLLAACGFAVTGPVVPAAADDATAATAPPPGAAAAGEVDGLPALKKLYDGGRLRLSSDGDSAADAFYFTLTGWVREPQGRADVGVWRDGKKLLVWSWSYPPDGNRDRAVATCAAVEGLFVGLDPKNPGGLVILEGGWPEVVFRGAEDGQSAEYRVGYRTGAAPAANEAAGGDAAARPAAGPAERAADAGGQRSARVEFDAKGLIRNTFPKMLSASLVPDGMIKVKTENTTMDLRPAKAGPAGGPAGGAAGGAGAGEAGGAAGGAERAACAVDYVMITGQRQAVTFYAPPEGLRPPPTVERLTAAAVRQLGMPLRDLAAEDAAAREAALAAHFDVPVADFYSDPRHATAAGKLWGLIHPRGEGKAFERKLEF